MRKNHLFHNLLNQKRERHFLRRLFHKDIVVKATAPIALVGLMTLLSSCGLNSEAQTESIPPIIDTHVTEAVHEEPDSAAREAARKAALRAELEAQGLDRRIIVDKPHLKLLVVEKGDTIFRAGICCGAARGDKTKKDDNKTPEGDFRIAMIQNSKDWLWNPGDGRPLVPNCYGPWFLRLDSPFHSIGIHGTGAPRSIGHRSSHGCIRVTNENISRLKELVEVGTRVTIIPDRVSGPLIAKDDTKQEPSTPKTTTAPASIADAHEELISDSILSIPSVDPTRGQELELASSQEPQQIDAE